MTASVEITNTSNWDEDVYVFHKVHEESPVRWEDLVEKHEDWGMAEVGEELARVVRDRAYDGERLEAADDGGLVARVRFGRVIKGEKSFRCELTLEDYRYDAESVVTVVREFRYLDEASKSRALSRLHDFVAMAARCKVSRLMRKEGVRISLSTEDILDHSVWVEPAPKDGDYLGEVEVVAKGRGAKRS